MQKRKLIIIFLLFLGINFHCFSQSENIPKDSLLADFNTLFSTIKQVHVNMFSNISKETFDEHAKKIKQKISKDMTASDFYLLVEPLVVSLGDGHTNLQFPISIFQKSDPLLFPYTLKVNKKDLSFRVISYYGKEKSHIPQNAVITSINQIPSKRIIEKLMHYCNGEKDFYKITTLNNNFNYLFYLLYPNNKFNIHYLVKGEKRSIETSAEHLTVMAEQSKKQRKKKNILKHPSYYSYYHLKNIKTIILDLKEFKDLKKFEKFLNKVFSIINKEKIENLIIDIRNNGGGNSKLGDELFQYISPVPFQQFGKAIVKTSQKQKDYYLKNKEFSKEEKQTIMLKKTGIKIYNNPSLIPLRKNKLRFKGNTYLLISHKTFSSASSFSWAFKYFNMGKIIGEESGGLAVSFGDVIIFTLPHTHLKYSVSYKKFYLFGAKENDIHGTIPDYKINADEALDFTLKLIKNRNIIKH